MSISGRRVAQEFAFQFRVVGEPQPLLSMWLWLGCPAIAAMLAVLVAMVVAPDLKRQLWASVASIVMALGAYAPKRLCAMRAAPWRWRAACGADARAVLGKRISG